MPPAEPTTQKTALMKRLRPLLAAPPYAHAAGLWCAVSGGMDSMVMLDLLRRMRHVHQSPLRVMHIHHHTGPTADAGARLVTDYCREHGIVSQHVDFHWDKRGNFEYEAAQFRHRKLLEVCGKGEFVLIAHHLRDQVETMFQTLARGAGIATPLGMVARNGRQLRPMLDIEGALIADHARVCGVPHVLDPSNYDRSNFRNAVRGQVLPVLSAFHDHCEQRIGGWLREHHELRAALDLQAQRVFSACYCDGFLARHAFSQADPFLWPFILRHFWQASGLSNPKRQIQDQLIGWLKESATGSFEHAQQRVFCDIDGIAIFPPIPGSGLHAHLGESLVWGPWRFRLEWCGPALEWTGSLHEDGFQLLPAVSLPKPVREFYRLREAPLRFRQMLPAIAAAGRIFFAPEIVTLEARGFWRLIQSTGPAWKNLLDHPPFAPGAPTASEPSPVGRTPVGRTPVGRTPAGSAPTSQSRVSRNTIHKAPDPSKPGE